MRLARRLLLIGASVMAAFGCSYIVAPSRAASMWSAPRLVFEAAGRLGGQDLIVDAYGRVHATWVAQEYFGLGNIPSTVYYQRLDLTNSEPVELTTSEYPQAGPTIAVGGDDTVFVNISGNSAIHARILDAQALRAWATAHGDVRALYYGQILADRDGTIWMAYADQSGGAILLQRWRREIEAWDAPIEVARTETNGTAADYVRAAFGGDGSIHVTWGEFRLPSGWPPTGVYYARSGDSGKTWSRVEAIAPGPYDQSTVVVGPANEVVLAWNGYAGIGGRYVRISRDGGQSWSAVSALVPPGKGGSEGPPGIVIDARGIIHAITSYDNCAWYLALANGTWSRPECISDSPNVPRGHLEQPSLTLGMGNRLHAMFFADDTKLFHTFRDIDAPGAQGLPTPTRPVATLPPTPTPPARAATPTPAPPLNAGPPFSPVNTPDALLASGLAPLLLVGLAAIVVGLRMRR